VCVPFFVRKTDTGNWGLLFTRCPLPPQTAYRLFQKLTASPYSIKGRGTGFVGSFIYIKLFPTIHFPSQTGHLSSNLCTGGKTANSRRNAIGLHIFVSIMNHILLKHSHGGGKTTLLPAQRCLSLVFHSHCANSWGRKQPTYRALADRRCAEPPPPP
jgi:hypothetical protein